MRGARLVVFFLLLAALAGCAATKRVLDGARPSHWTWAARRADYLHRGRVWLGEDLASWVRREPSLDLLAGPPGPDAFAPEELVRCEHVKPRQAFTGATPKFLCRRQRNGRADTFKVKYGADNGEIYAEVAGSRLFWALGFASDSDYPVRVECLGCADDPWSDQETHPGHVPPVFDPALIDRPLPGRVMQEWPDQGWTWAEFDTIDPAFGGAPRAHTDALKLLAAFVQHRDSKADNQHMICPPQSERKEPGGRRDCEQPVMFIHDLGSVFGGPKLFGATRKMTLEAWRSQPVWKDPRNCTVELTKELDAIHGLRRPQIGEEGRRFLATLLAALDDRQITDLFTAARADRRGGVANWVAAFKARRDQVLHPVPDDPDFRCPD